MCFNILAQRNQSLLEFMRHMSEWVARFASPFSLSCELDFRAYTFLVFNLFLVTFFPYILSHSVIGSVITLSCLMAETSLSAMMFSWKHWFVLAQMELHSTRRNNCFVCFGFAGLSWWFLFPLSYSCSACSQYRG